MTATADGVRPGPPPALGVAVAGYRVEQLLSTDSVSCLYRAVQQGRAGSTPRPVTLRLTHPLRTDDRPDTDVVTACLRDVDAAAAVIHPALLPILDVGATDDRVHIATAMPGDAVTLARYVRSHGRLALDDAVALLLDVAEALDRAHAAGVVHGAISPRTILVRRAGSEQPPARVRGYGIATLLSRQARIDRTAIDVLDVAYTAPERLRGGSVDGRADQYALACALYHCLSGRLPFRRDTAAGLFGAHLFSDPPISELDDHDRGLAGALRAGMDKLPDQRHDSCVDLLRSTGRGIVRRATDHDVTSRVRVETLDRDPRPTVAWPDAPPRGNGRDPDDVDEPRPTTDALDQRPRRRGLSWPLATMGVLAGIVTTFVVVALARGGSLDLASLALAEQATSDSPAAAGGAPESAGVVWQHTVHDEPLYDIRAVDGTVLAATPHRVAALSAERGTPQWSDDITIGVLTDLAVTDEIVALRGAQLDGLGIRDGKRRWRHADIAAPISSLATDGTTLYGIGVGRVAPELLALDATTGRRRWSFNGGGRRIAHDAVVAVRDRAVAMVDGDTLWLLDRAEPMPPTAGVSSSSRARARWQLEIAEPWPDSLALLPDVVVLAHQSGEVCAYDPADGAQRWCQLVPGVAQRAPTIIAERDVVAVMRGSQVTALSIASGARRWSFETPRPLTPTATATGRHLVVSDVNGVAHGLDLSTGHEVWRASGFGEITALTATTDGVYVGTRAGLLVKVQPSPEASA